MHFIGFEIGQNFLHTKFIIARFYKKCKNFHERKKEQVLKLVFGENDIENYEDDVEMVMSDNGYDVRVEIFTVGRIECKNHNGVTVDCYIRRCHTTQTEILKSASQIFYPQFYKIWKEGRIFEIDMAFLAEGQIAHFDNPLELVAIY